MRHKLFLSLLFVIIGLGSQMAFGQRPCTVPTATFTPTVSHATCFNPKGSITFATTVSSGSAYMQSLVLKNAAGTTVYTHSPSQSLSGSISNLDVGMYTFTGTVVIEYLCNGLGYMTTVSINMQVWVGIQTVWREFIDMYASPNSYSAKRNGNTQTYGGARSSNGIASGNGWIEMKAQYGTTTNNRVFWLIGEHDPLGTFSPSSNLQYIEFYKGSAGNGIRIKYQTTGGSYTFATLSTVNTDKIRLIRTGSTITIQKNDVNTTIFTLPVAYTGGMNIAVRSLAQNDGCLNVVSSFECVVETDYAELRKNVDGGSILVLEGLLKFTYDEEYAIAINYLPFKIYDKQRSIVASSDGQGNVTGISTPLVYQEDDARYVIDLSTVSSMSINEFYTLEVIDSKGSKKYLKFFYKN